MPAGSHDGEDVVRIAEPAPSARLMHIGVVAERTELSIRTLRHYDEVGLVRPSARSEGRFRLYTEADVDRLRTIRRMKPVGFTLEQMRDLLEAIAILDRPTATEDERERAADTITTHHEQAQQSCVKLRRQLAYAEELTGLLADLGERHWRDGVEPG